MNKGPKAANKAATFAGFSAVLMWSLLAVFTDATGKIPPFQLATMTFAIATLVGIMWAGTRKSGASNVSVRPHIALFGGIGLFAYHALYFAALKSAPAVEASLIAYLWPLLIVVGSALLPGEKLRSHHIVGALAGFCGTILIVTGGKGLSINADFIFGYGLALAAAFTWTAYSLLSRSAVKVPTHAVIYYCAISTVLSAIAHLVFETTIMPTTTTQWLAILGLGLLPVGAAFYVWDYGMKHGDVQIVGASSYAAPLLSTLILVIFANAPFNWAVVVACVLITAGAALAAKDLIFKT